MIKIIFFAISLVSFVLYRAEKLNASGHANWKVSNSAREISGQNKVDDFKKVIPFYDTKMYLTLETKDRDVRSTWDLRPFVINVSSK
jgi:hypothetical protein